MKLACRPCTQQCHVLLRSCRFGLTSVSSLLYLLVSVVQLSIADISVVARLNWIRGGSLDGIATTIADGFPLLVSLVDRVMAEPKIVAYMEARPKKN